MRGCPSYFYLAAATAQPAGTGAVALAISWAQGTAGWNVHQNLLQKAHNSGVTWLLLNNCTMPVKALFLYGTALQDIIAVKGRGIQLSSTKTEGFMLY